MTARRSRIVRIPQGWVQCIHLDVILQKILQVLVQALIGIFNSLEAVQ